LAEETLKQDMGNDFGSRVNDILVMLGAVKLNAPFGQLFSSSKLLLNALFDELAAFMKPEEKDKYWEVQKDINKLQPLKVDCNGRVYGLNKRDYGVCLGYCRKIEHLLREVMARVELTVTKKKENTRLS